MDGLKLKDVTRKRKRMSYASRKESFSINFLILVQVKWSFFSKSLQPSFIKLDEGKQWLITYIKTPKEKYISM